MQVTATIIHTYFETDHTVTLVKCTSAKPNKKFWAATHGIRGAFDRADELPVIEDFCDYLYEGVTSVVINDERPMIGCAVR